MRRSLAAVAAAFFVSALLGGQAVAGAHWCEQDPVFAANGNIIDVTTVFDSAHADAVSGPIYFVLFVPRNTLLPAVVSVDGDIPVLGFISPTLPAESGQRGGTRAVLNIWMNADRSFPTYTRITGLTALGARTTLLATVEGNSRSVQTLSFRLPLGSLLGGGALPLGGLPVVTQPTSLQVPALVVPPLRLP